jgi:hypothetical protein
MRATKLTITVLCFVLIGCAPAAALRPASQSAIAAPVPQDADVPEALLSGRDPRFPTDRYITGTGQGPTLAEARAHATADIGSQIQAQISSVLTSVESAQVDTASGRDAKSSSISKLHQELRQTTHFEPDGMVTVGNSRADHGIVYVLAVLNRAAAVSRYHAQAHKARQELTSARGIQSHALSEAKLREAARLTVEIRAHATELARALTLEQAVSGRALDPGEWSAVIAATEAQSELRRMAASIEVEVCVQGTADFSEGEHLAATITDQVASHGPTVRLCGRPSDRPGSMRIEGTVRGTFFHDANLPGVWLCQPSVDLTVSQAGKVLSRASLGGEPARAAGPDRESAARASLAELARQSAAQLAELFGE